MMERTLQAIVQYNMTDTEAKAFKIACLYEQIAQKLFPGLRFNSFWIGDPRKKELFKYCWKMLHDTAGKLHPSDYKLYIYAQLQVFKAYAKGDRPPLIHPNCLVGSNSWRRWLAWKRQYDQRKLVKASADFKVADEKIVAELKKTKDYLLMKFRRHDREDIREALNSRTLLRWVTLKSVSGYYVHLSPTVTEWLRDNELAVDEYFGYSVGMCSKSITPEVKDYFMKEFGYEYGENVDDSDT